MLETKINRELRTQWPVFSPSGSYETFPALQLWSQIIGKIKLALSPKCNHWWHITFHVTPTGLSTGLMQYKNIFFQIDLNFLEQKVDLILDNGRTDSLELKTRSVADFYEELFLKLKSFGINIKIWTMPVELQDPVPFEKDRKIRKYSPEEAISFLKVLQHTVKTMEIARSRFLGKASPIHFFWGSFDLAVTFFSGRPAPKHPGAPNVAQQIVEEAYSHEVCSMGFWPGTGLGEPAFYSYMYPEPAGFSKFPGMPEGVYYHPDFKEFIFPYKIIEDSGSSEKLLNFFNNSLKAAFALSDWESGLIRENWG